MKLLQDFHDVFRMLKRRSPSQIYCPRCGSPEIKVANGFVFGISPRRYLCAKCGYSGPVVMELEKEEG